MMHGEVGLNPCNKKGFKSRRRLEGEKVVEEEKTKEEGRRKREERPRKWVVEIEKRKRGATVD